MQAWPWPQATCRGRRGWLAPSRCGNLPAPQRLAAPRMPPRQAVLGIENGSFFHGSQRVFAGVSFLLDGARTGLVGENGAGKSTLLKCLTGELELVDGSIVRSRSLRVGYVPQEIPVALD